MKCPKCGLINPETALHCDCGYDFQKTAAFILYDKMPRSAQSRSNTKAWFRQLAALTGVAMLAFMAMPYERTIVPEARLQVQDEAGAAQAGILVKERWRDWSSESTEHEVAVRSDSEGYVMFPQRTIRTCRLCIFVGAVGQVASQGAHASFGPVAFIEAYGKDPHVWTFEQYIPGRSLPTALRLKRWKTPLCPPEQLVLPCLPQSGSRKAASRS